LASRRLEAIFCALGLGLEGPGLGLGLESCNDNFCITLRARLGCDHINALYKFTITYYYLPSNFQGPTTAAKLKLEIITIN